MQNLLPHPFGTPSSPTHSSCHTNWVFFSPHPQHPVQGAVQVFIFAFQASLSPPCSFQWGKKSQPQTQVWPSWAARTFPCRACAHTARAQRPSRAAVSLSEVTQAQKGCPPLPATRPHLLSDTDGQFGRTVCTYARDALMSFDPSSLHHARSITFTIQKTKEKGE